MIKKNTFYGGLLLSLLITLKTYGEGHKINPYSEVSIVTNSQTWPATADNKDFSFGTVQSGDADSLLLKQVEDNQGLLFLPGFNFGVAHSAYQYEGNRLAPNIEQPFGEGWSIWDVFSEKGSWLNPQSSNIATVLPTSRYTLPNGEFAIQGYYPEFYQQDMQLAKELGVNYYRISISWPRLFPHPGMVEPDPAAIRYYQHVLSQLRAKGFNVLITLYHWDLPAWLYNYGDSEVAENDKTYGWLDKHEAKDNLTLLEFQKYADAVFKNFGTYTPYFATFNEPLTFTNSALYQGVHAPGKEGFALLRQIDPLTYGRTEKESDERLNYWQSANLIKAHYIAYKTFANYRAIISNTNHSAAMLGIVLNADWAEPYRIVKNSRGELQYHPDDVNASKRNMDFMLGWWLEPVLLGHWPKSMEQLVGERLPSLTADKSCLATSGKPIACDAQQQTLASYIAEGGALDYLNLNHYTGYFVADLPYAKQHFSATIQEKSVPPNQYGTSPFTLAAGWDSDQQTFVTQFRYQKYGAMGEFAAKDQSRVFLIGMAGAKPWLRHTFFSYTKLLQYINYYYLSEKLFTKQHLPLSQLEIYLTENGTSLVGESQKTTAEQLKDPDRVRFIKGNLAAVWQAIQQGIPVKLYTYWSIADNFEWSEGYDSRFGLIWIDYANHFARQAKDSYYYYQSCIKNNKVMP